MGIRFFTSGRPVLFALFAILSCSNAINENPGFKLGKTISLPEVSGRIDHLAINVEKGIVYLAAVGNNTVEVIDVKKGEVLHTIKNLDEPQGIVFIRAHNSLVVANGGNGECDLFDADSFLEKSSIKLSGDADNVRYDSISDRIYVGYGEGGIAVIDATEFKLLGEIKLPGHPESFQLNKGRDTMFVNVPDAEKIEVLDLKKLAVISEWKIDARANFPMAIDPADHLLFIGCRRPSVLKVLNTANGNTVATLDCSGDADDVFYDSDAKEVMISCGAGYLDVFKISAGSTDSLISRIPTRSGARTGLFVPGLNQFFLAVPATMTSDAELRIYDRQ